MNPQARQVVRRMVIRVLPLLLVMFFIVAFWTSFGFGDRNVLPSAVVGNPLPKFEMASLDGESVISESDLTGPALLNIWGTWCAACLDEHPLFMQLAAAGVRIFGSNYKDDRTAALAWLEELGNPYQFSVFDPDGQLGIELGVYGAPSTYLIDENGIIVDKHVGAISMALWKEKFAYAFPSVAL